MWFGMTIALSFGIVLQPHIMIRYYTAVSGRTIKWLGATTPIYLMSLYIPAALVGLGGAVALPGLEVPDQVFPELLFRYANPWVTGLILAGATAAAMSTLDSILHANMTVLTRDVYMRYVAADRSQAHYLLVGRLIVVGLLAVGYVLSVTTADFLVTLVTLSGAGALQLMPAMLGGARHALRRAGPASASVRDARRRLGVGRELRGHLGRLPLHRATHARHRGPRPRGRGGLRVRVGRRARGPRVALG
jgi:SSS family solute:Na+ symporter